MRITFYYLLIALTLLSTATKAEVKLNPEEGVSVLAINGNEIKSGNFFSGTTELTTEDGINQIVVQYTAEIPSSGDDFTLETSKVFVLTFEATDTEITIKEPRIKSENQLEKFNQTMAWSLVKTDGKNISYKVDTLEKEGFQFTRDYRRELEDFNQTNSPAALKNTAIKRSLNKIKTQQETNNNLTKSTEKNMAADMLRFWYEQADPNTRADFLRWITTK